MANSEELIRKSIAINKFIRTYYIRAFCRREVLPRKPFGGSPTESIGPWPEIIYKGFRCQRSEAGLCSPCGYSNIDRVPNHIAAVNRAILSQTQYVLNRFEEVIMGNQTRKSPYPAFDKKHVSGRDAMMALTTTGSFFSHYELEQEMRIKVLQMISAHAHLNQINLQIFLESHAADIIDYYEKGEFDDLLPLLKDMNAVIVVGLESVDDFSRNVLYCKNLSLNEFERAITIIKRKLELEAGAFLFAGLHPMNDYETLLDIKKSLSYLKAQQIMPVIMVSNLKPYTLNHLLYTEGRYNLPDPRTILSIVRMLEDGAPNLEKTEKWLFADPGGGPPEPSIHPFNNPLKKTCDKCSSIIWHAICGYNMKGKANGLRETYDWIDFEQKIGVIDNCDCNSVYEESIEQLRTGSPQLLVDRASQNLSHAEGVMKAYCDVHKRLLRK